MLELKPLQEQEVLPLLARKRGGIFWHMGLGKTGAASVVGARTRLRRWLIICPDNALSVWGTNPRYKYTTIKDWIKSYWPDHPPIKIELIDGAPWNRDLVWNAPYDSGCIHIRVVTRSTFVVDWSLKTKIPGRKGKKSTQLALNKRVGYNVPQIVIYDECRDLRNKDTQRFKTFAMFMNWYTPEYLMLLSGTPGHEPKHFWTYLHLIDPRYFRTYWGFVNAFHVIDDGMWGKEINEPRNLPQWYALRDRFLSVLSIEDPRVQAMMPKLTRQLLPVTMDDVQRRVYNQLKDELLVITPEGDMIVAQNSMVLLTRLRQLLVCPRILGSSLSYGGAIHDFAETMGPEDHNVIFTPFTAAFPHFKAYLDQHGFRHVYGIQGGMGTPERDEAIERWRGSGGVMLCSTLYAQAFSLEPAPKCFHIGYDWDPDNNAQADARIARLTTQYPVQSYYYTYQSSFDENIAGIVNMKQQRVSITTARQLREMFHDEADYAEA